MFSSLSNIARCITSRVTAVRSVAGFHTQVPILQVATEGASEGASSTGFVPSYPELKKLKKVCAALVPFDESPCSPRST